MRTTGSSELVGMTQLGVEIFNALGAIYRELMVIDRTEEGEIIFHTMPGGLNVLLRQFEGLWRRLAGIEREPLYEEILGELADRPRQMEDLARRLIRKEAAKSITEVRLAVADLFASGVLTGRPEEIYVLS